MKTNAGESKPTVVFWRLCHSGCKQNTLVFPSLLHLLGTGGPPARLGDPQIPLASPRLALHGARGVSSGSRLPQKGALGPS